MGRACCTGKGVRIIRVGNSKVGLTGLDSVLEQAYLEAWSPADEGLGQRLVEGLRAAKNYIAPASEAAYAEALVGVYKEYVEAARRSKTVGTATSRKAA